MLGIQSGCIGNKSKFCWDQNDPYFSAAVIGIIEQLNSGKIGVKKKEFFFVGLNALTLNYFLNNFDCIALQDYPIVIICSSHLLPLAAYILGEHRQVRAVFTNSCSVEDIIATLRKIDISGRKVVKPRRPGRHQILTSKDVMILRLYMASGNISSLIKVYNGGLSTFYNWRARVSQKFGVRKLEHLLIPDW
ncbi:hypothetical protein [Salmonella enterica]|uniref:hypothetical protein n=1 Tax=Salmonella enterica TaxID=28901 RepID=UPI0009AC0CAB|nr:hypothetical protein [Salmonella enterica]EBF4234912.1 hypothetical protein [Salmonella enterica]